MPFRPCPTGCGFYLSPNDRHDRCVQCLGREHAEAAFVNGDCQYCEDMPLGTLRSRAAFFSKKPRRHSTASRSGPSTSGYEAAAMCVEQERQGDDVLPGTSSQTVHPVCPPIESQDDFESSSQYGLDLLFGAPAEGKVESVASEGEPSEADVTAELAASAGESQSVADAEMAAALKRAAKEIGVVWVPPPSPEPSRLDDWFLGGRDSRPRSSPVPFFPEVHEELTKSWKAPLSARSRHANSPSLTTLDGGPARGYTEVPQVERAIAMHLCPQNAASWRGPPRLPSRACKFSSTLVAKAYAASGQAASALHAMAILQVYQAKVLKDLHEGVPDPELLHELRSATDYALRATKVTAQALGRAMSTMVVQERHLWLNLAEMRDAEKARFLDAPISQAGLFGEAVEEFAQQFSTAKQQTEAIKHILPRRAASAGSAQPTQQPPSAPRRGRPPTRMTQAPQPAGPAARPSLRSSSRRKVAPPARPQPREGGSSDLSGSALDEGTSAGFGFYPAVCRTADGYHMVNKRAISFFSGRNLQHLRPSTRRSDAVSIIRSIRPHDTCTPVCSETTSSFRRSPLSGGSSAQLSQVGLPGKNGQCGSGLLTPGHALFSQRRYSHPWYTESSSSETPSGEFFGLAKSPQSFPLAPQDNSARLRHPVCAASTQVPWCSHYVGSGPQHHGSSSRNRSPSGEGCDRSCPLSRDEERVLQPLLHCTQERWRSQTNLGSEGLESGPAQAPVQDVNPQAHPHVCQTSRLVCGHRPEGRVLSCLNPPKTQTVSAVCLRRTGISVQGSPLRPLPVAPGLYEGSGGRPCPPQGNGHTHSQLSRRLANSSSLVGFGLRTQGHGSQPSGSVGASGQLGKEQTLPGTEDLFSRYRAGLGQYVCTSLPGACTVSSEVCGNTQIQVSGPPKTGSEAPRAHGILSRGHAAGSDAHETAAALASYSSPQVGLASRYIPGEHHTIVSPDTQPLDRHYVPTVRSSPGTGVQTHHCHHRCFQDRLGCHLQRAGSFRGLDRPPTVLAHKLSGVVGSAPGPEEVPSYDSGQARVGQDRQHCDCGLHQPPGRCTLLSHVTTSPPPAALESTQTQVSTSHSHSGRSQSCGRFPVATGFARKRVETPPSVGPADLGSIRPGTSGPLCLTGIHPLPAVVRSDRGPPRDRRTGTQLAKGPTQVCFSPGEPHRTNPVQSQGGRGTDSLGGPLLAQQNLVLGSGAPGISSSLAHSSEEGPPFSGEGHNLAPAPRSLEPPPLVPGRDQEDFRDLSPSVVNTLLQARAPSTRRLYDLRWRIFVNWCSSHGKDPRSCGIKSVLSFLQEGLDRHLSASTLKVHVAAISANHDLVGGRSVGKHDLITRFLRGARRLNPPRPHLIPSWDLAVVLQGLQQDPFEPLQSVKLDALSFKTALLTALTSIKRVGDLQALSVNSSCLEFGPAYSHVVLRPRPGYVPKVPTTPFRDQVVTLQAFSSQEDDPNLIMLCPVRALRIYMERTQPFRRSEQLFVCYGGQQKGKAVSKQRISHWLVNAIRTAYLVRGLPCPLEVRAHSTRGIAASAALANGASLTDICRAAGWATPNTFARFYNLRTEPVSARVLVANS
ncbi:hypothetical protein M9458_058035 [Cirrhinus mrigala]|uniref:Core-binding (CB) domain-containing protein n=1 Tax=Cirrhinus mrigala TaxID=683832 RepID=A0ABD0MBF0_CIRMR